MRGHAQHQRFYEEETFRAAGSQCLAPLIETPIRQGACRIRCCERRICTGRPVVNAAFNCEHRRSPLTRPARANSQLSPPSTIPQIMASLVSMREAMEAAFCRAVRVTLVGSITPAF